MCVQCDHNVHHSHDSFIFAHFFTLLYIFTIAVVNLDLSDEDGNVKLIQDNLERYANEILNERERFVLLQVDSKLLKL